MKRIGIIFLCMIMVSFSTRSLKAQIDIEEGLVGYWNFNEGSGSVAYDQSDYGNDGTIHGANWITGVSGEALEFNGIGDYIHVPDDNSLDNTNQFTVSLWLNLSSFGGEFCGTDCMPILTKWLSAGSYGTNSYYIFERGGVFTFAVSDDNNYEVVFFNHTSSINSWHHLSYVYYEGIIQSYFDRDLVSEDTINVDYITNSSEPLKIGAWYHIYDDTYSSFHGMLDEVRIYDRALIEEEIQYLYDLNNPYFCQDFSGLFCDDFEDGVDPAWVQTEGSCTWQATGGVFQTSLSGMTQSCVQSVGDQSWGNYVFEVAVRGNEGADKIVSFRQHDSETLYFVNLRSDWQGQDELFLGKQYGGQETILHTMVYPSQNGTWYDLKIICVDEQITVFVDGIDQISIDDNDDPIYSGGIGLVAFTGGSDICDISFDNVRVTDPFPHIEFTPNLGGYVGDYLSIEGQLLRFDGSPYTCSFGCFGVEDPVTKFTAIIDVSTDGNFAYTTGQSASWANTYMFTFRAGTDLGIVRFPFMLPVQPVEMPEGVYVSPHKARPDVGALELDMKPVTDAYGMRHNETLYPAERENMIYKGRNLWEDVKASVSTSWGQVISEGVSGKVYSNAQPFVELCSYGSPGDCAVVAASYGYLIDETYEEQVKSFFHAFADLAYESDYIDECSRAQWHEKVEDAAFRLTLQDAGLGDPISMMEVLAHFAEYGEILELHDNVWNFCTPGERLQYGALTLVIDNPVLGITQFIIGGVIQVMERALVIRGMSPISLRVTDPLGRTISIDSNEIPFSSYETIDPSFEGIAEDIVIIPAESVGGYSIEIIPDSTALPSDSFTVIAHYTYFEEPIVLAENMPISDIPDLPFEVETFDNLPPDPFSLLEPNGTVFESLPITFSWNSTSDPNPDHSVFYDLIISTDNAFTDSLVVYDIIEASYVFTGSLPVDDQNNEYFWKIRAHDLWGESTISNETFSFFYIPQDIPTLSEWGMLIMGLLLLAFGTIAVVRRRKVVIN